MLWSLKACHGSRRQTTNASCMVCGSFQAYDCYIGLQQAGDFAYIAAHHVGSHWLTRISEVSQLLQEHEHCAHVRHHSSTCPRISTLSIPNATMVWQLSNKGRKAMLPSVSAPTRTMCLKPTPERAKKRCVAALSGRRLLARLIVKLKMRAANPEQASLY